MPSEYKISALPEQRSVTPGAQVTYSLEPHPGAPSVDKVTARWFAINDPKVVTMFRPSMINGPIGPVWRDATWAVAGLHRIVCRVTHDGETTDYTYEQWVVPLSGALVGGPRLPRHQDDPDATLDVLSRQADVLKAVNAQFPPTTPGDKDKFEKLLKGIETFRDKLSERLQSTRNFKKHPFQAEHFEAKTQKRSPLRVFLCKTEAKKWVIVDWTIPMVRSATGEYEGFGDTSQEAVHAALQNWNEDNRYPEGGISFRIPAVLDLREEIGQFDTDGSAYWDSVSAFLGWIGLGAAVLAGVVTLIAPVPGSQLVSAAIWTSIFSSSAAAVINIGTRVDEGFSSWQANAFDVLTVVGNLFGATGIVWSRGANVLINTGNKVAKCALIGAVTTQGVQGVMLGADYVTQLEAIQNDPSIPPDERTNRIVRLLSAALVDGLLIYVSVKGTKADLANLDARGNSGGLTSGERLKQLSDPAATVDLTKPPKVEGATAAEGHTTRVNIDQEMEVPHQSGHSGPRESPRHRRRKVRKRPLTSINFMPKPKSRRSSFPR